MIEDTIALQQFHVVGQLASTDDNKQEQALRGLFELKDPRSLHSLISYFYGQPEGEIGRVSIYDWLDLIWELDWKIGIEFTTKLLERNNTHYSNADIVPDFYLAWSL